uniref:Uncharacterized protein n=1 Tax=Plectus sambesii TaxID=2011161 RepID=A0A914UNY5_9BILA
MIGAVIVTVDVEEITVEVTETVTAIVMEVEMMTAMVAVEGTTADVNLEMERLKNWCWPQSALKIHFAVPTVIALAVGTASTADALVGMSIGIAAPTVIALAVGPASTADAFVQEIAATATEIALAEMSAFAVFVSSVVIDSSATPTATADQDLNANVAVALREVPDDAIVISTATGMKHAIMVVASSVVIKAIVAPIETAFEATASLDAA